MIFRLGNDWCGITWMTSDPKAGKMGLLAVGVGAEAAELVAEKVEEKKATDQGQGGEDDQPPWSVDGI